MADTKLADLTAVTSVLATDILYTVIDPAGTPLDRKVPISVLRGTQFQSTAYRHTADITTTSTSFVDIDGTNLPALSVTLAVGDKVICEFSGSFGHSAAGVPIHVDWLIDRPVSADTAFRTIYGGASAGAVELGTSALDANARLIRALFTATEAGIHTFKPQWKTTSGTARLMNIGTHGTVMVHTVEKKF